MAEVATKRGTVESCEDNPNLRTWMDIYSSIDIDTNPTDDIEGIQSKDVMLDYIENDLKGRSLVEIQDFFRQKYNLPNVSNITCPEMKDILDMKTFAYLVSHDDITAFLHTLIIEVVTNQDKHSLLFSHQEWKAIADYLSTFTTLSDSHLPMSLFEDMANVRSPTELSFTDTYCYAGACRRNPTNVPRTYNPEVWEFMDKSLAYLNFACLGYNILPDCQDLDKQIGQLVKTIGQSELVAQLSAAEQPVHLDTDNVDKVLINVS